MRGEEGEIHLLPFIFCFPSLCKFALQTAFTILNRHESASKRVYVMQEPANWENTSPCRFSVNNNRRFSPCVHVHTRNHQPPPPPPLPAHMHKVSARQMFPCNSHVISSCPPPHKTIALFVRPVCVCVYTVYISVSKLLMRQTSFRGKWCFLLNSISCQAHNN